MTDTSPAAPASALNAHSVRLVLRPLATPLPLGFLGLFFATLLFAGLQLGWVPQSQARVLAVAVLVFTVPVQFIACIYGFLVRDLVAGTGMGVLAGTWATVAVVTLADPRAQSAGLGLVLVMAGVAVCIPAVAAGMSKVLAAAVNLGVAARFWVTAVYEWGAPHGWEEAAGVVGVALGALALYAALAFELEDQRRATVLPTWRRGSGAEAMEGDLAAQVSRAHHEAGVRKAL